MGQKLQKRVRTTSTTTYTDYQGGFHYENYDLKFFATAEGYVNVTTRGYNYVYNYTDHLGNVRLSYMNDRLLGLLILDENHYYPFGLKHKKYGSVNYDFVIIDEETEEGYYVGIDIVPPGVRKTYQYKYNGMEYQDELGLGWYDYMARNYDPAIGRWMNIDPLAEMSRKTSPYVYALNNPVFYIDPDGMLAESFDLNIDIDIDMKNDWTPNGDGTYTAEAGDSAATLAKDAGISFERANEIVQSQLGQNYIDTNGIEKSNVEIGDTVGVPEQQKEHQEKQEKLTSIDESIAKIDKKINTLSENIKTQKNVISELERQKEYIANKLIPEDRNNSMGDKTSGGGVGGVGAGAILSQHLNNEINRVNKSINKSNTQINNLLKDKTSLQNQKKKIQE